MYQMFALILYAPLLNFRHFS